MTTQYPLGDGRTLEIRDGDSYAVFLDGQLIAEPSRERVANGTSIELPMAQPAPKIA